MSQFLQSDLFPIHSHFLGDFLRLKQQFLNVHVCWGGWIMGLEINGLFCFVLQPPPNPC